MSNWKTFEVEVLRWHINAEGLPFHTLSIFIWERKSTTCSVVQWLPSGEVRTALTCPQDALALQKNT